MTDVPSGSSEILLKQCVTGTTTEVLMRLILLKEEENEEKGRKDEYCSFDEQLGRYAVGCFVIR